MKTLLIFLLLWLTTSLPVCAMSMYDDPRTILSFRDKALSPELDILRVMVTLSPASQLIFQVKTKGERQSGAADGYLLLQILHGKHYILLIPINAQQTSHGLVYERTLQSEDAPPVLVGRKFQTVASSDGFAVKRIPQGVEFIVPLEWIDFSVDFGYDAYTVQARLQDGSLQVSHIYDQAGKGRPGPNRFSAITFLNRICSPQR